MSAGSQLDINEHLSPVLDFQLVDLKALYSLLCSSSSSRLEYIEYRTMHRRTTCLHTANPIIYGVVPSNWLVDTTAGLYKYNPFHNLPTATVRIY